MKLLLLFSAMIFLVSCQPKDRSGETQIDRNGIVEREKLVSQRERAVQKREAELASRELHMDSILNHLDTLGVVNPKFAGDWNIDMRCTETSCQGSAIGDTKTEKWKIGYKDDIAIAQVLMKGKLVRTYSGQYKGNRLVLSVKKQQSDAADISVTLWLRSQTKMEGRREVTQEDGCKIVYSIDAQKL